MNKDETITLSNKQLRKLQMVELDILVEVDRICRKHNIEYFLAGGTLIGAIRHNGFIPWDDDIDISMTRENYNKFIEVQKKELNTDKYYFESMETDENCGMLYAKVKRKNSKYIEFASDSNRDNLGIWIDIFPIDKVKNNGRFSNMKYTVVYCLKMVLLKKYGYLTKMSDAKKNFMVKIISFVSIFFSKKRLKKKK